MHDWELAGLDIGMPAQVHGLVVLVLVQQRVARLGDEARTLMSSEAIRRAPKLISYCLVLRCGHFEVSRA